MIVKQQLKQQRTMVKNRINVSDDVQEIEHRGNLIISKFNGRSNDYYFYLVNEDKDVEEFGPYDSLVEAKATMDEILDETDSPYLQNN